MQKILENVPFGGNHSYFNENEYKTTTFSSIVKYRMVEMVMCVVWLVFKSIGRYGYDYYDVLCSFVRTTHLHL